MRALVVYESMYGNTWTVAEAVGHGLADRGVDIEVVEVGVAPATPHPAVDLLVVGGPTHAFGMSRQTTRESAAEKAQRTVVSQGVGLREWLDALPRDGHRLAAAFDTHIDKPRMPGSAAKSAAKQLRRRGYVLVMPAESFYVSDSEGPLVDGEVERARRWGAELAIAGDPAAPRAHPA